MEVVRRARAGLLPQRAPPGKQLEQQEQQEPQEHEQLEEQELGEEVEEAFGEEAEETLREAVEEEVEPWVEVDEEGRPCCVEEGEEVEEPWVDAEAEAEVHERPASSRARLLLQPKLRPRQPDHPPLRLAPVPLPQQGGTLLRQRGPRQAEPITISSLGLRRLRDAYPAAGLPQLLRLSQVQEAVARCEPGLPPVDRVLECASYNHIMNHIAAWC